MPSVDREFPCEWTKHTQPQPKKRPFVWPWTLWESSSIAEETQLKNIILEKKNTSYINTFFPLKVERWEEIYGEEHTHLYIIDDIKWYKKKEKKKRIFRPYTNKTNNQWSGICYNQWSEICCGKYKHSSY